MENFTYGLVLTIVGMGGTILSLWFITVVVQILKRLLPHTKEDEQQRKEIV